VRTGDRIAGRYRLEQAVGSGGNGVVWRAFDEQLGRVVALKRAIPGDPGPYSEQLQQLRREARLLAQLNHPNIVTLFDVLDDGSDCWLVMEYVPAQSLAERGVQPAAVAAAIGAQIADALAAVHAKGILHRDVKPANVLMTSEWQAKLGDFGISRVLAGDETVTGSTVLAGTPGYLAPEVANGSDPTAASDVFSLGSTLYAAVEGTSPVGDTTDNAFLRLRRAAEGRIRPCSTNTPLTPVLTQLLQVDPRKRPTAAQAKELLARAAEERAVAPRRSRRLRLGVLAAAVLVVAAGVGTWFAIGAPHVDSPQQPFTGSVFGADEKTADPCKVVDPNVMAPFGDPNLVNDQGNFNQCNVIV
jgi:serine/threonine protein kinase